LTPNGIQICPPHSIQDLQINEIVLVRILAQNIPKVAQLTLEGSREVISSPSTFEPLVFFFFNYHFPVFVQLLSNGKRLSAQWLITCPTPTTYTKGKVALLCKAKALFLCKHARPDIQPIIAVLYTRVKGPNEANWAKLVRLMKYLKGTRELKLTLSADNLHCIKWYVDAGFAVHPDYKSHTGANMPYGDGDGTVQSISRKQKLNTKSSTKSKLVVSSGLNCT
jgi:hypothetical protein